MMVTVIELTDREQQTPLASHLRGGLATLKQRHEDFKVSEIQNGQINGLHFERQSFTGIAHAASKQEIGGRQMHGLLYAAVDGVWLISAMAMDVEPYHEETLSIMMASIATLHLLPSQ